jgi:cytosine/adenosine deaminase-related metal-dependent hydrolase
VINPGTSEQQSDTTVIAHDGQIVKVSTSKNTNVPGTVQVVNGAGKFLIPADMHTHFRDVDRDLKMVLGIRNMGGARSEVYPLRDEIAKGQLLEAEDRCQRRNVDGPDSFFKSCVHRFGWYTTGGKGSGTRA